MHSSLRRTDWAATTTADSVLTAAAAWALTGDDRWLVSAAAVDWVYTATTVDGSALPTANSPAADGEAAFSHRPVTGVLWSWRMVVDPHELAEQVSAGHAPSYRRRSKATDAAAAGIVSLQCRRIGSFSAGCDGA
ncbi:hypothetical protein PLESTB_000110900 [Pleodorina starrii]|uniref:Uncharacterized protein n=1 Tax=Pleodorina starrii TaxID=330485 RepID=A0A9W6EXZ9_9CHLO|nr:hypothetical protein PLESTB_000110900 [Pleodorina starrii]GLC71876.1 hypothetical protein PLESTF_001176500 [Pleodorina starrii]